MLNLFRDRAFWEGEHDTMPQPMWLPIVLAFDRAKAERRARRFATHYVPRSQYLLPIGPEPKVATIELPKTRRRLPWDGRTKKNSRKRKARVVARVHCVEERPKYSAWMHAYPGCDPDYG